MLVVVVAAFWVSPIAQGRMEIVFVPAAPAPPTTVPARAVSAAVPLAIRTKLRSPAAAPRLRPRAAKVELFWRMMSVAMMPATPFVPLAVP